MSVNEDRLCMGCMVQLGSAGPCGACGYDPQMAVNLNFLPPRTELGGRYLIGRLVSSDPEGAWYVGFDRTEEARVWVREYAPEAIVRRDHTDYSVKPLASAEAQYKALLSDFEDLSRSISQLPPSEKVFPVLDIISANNTVYAVYRYLKTITLESFLLRSGGKLSWRHAKKMLMPLVHTVVNIHKAGLIHRGLTPRTIHLDQSGALWLSEFTIAAARTNKSEIGAQLSDGYSAPEQYSLNSWQGAWTDVYALGAVFYRTVTGETPPPAMDRVYGDDLLDSQITNAEMNEYIVNAINKALAFEVEDRTQTAEAFIADLLATEGSNTAVYNAPSRKSYESRDDSLHRQEIRLAAAERDRQDAAPVRTAARFEDLDGGIDLMPPPGSVTARRNESNTRREQEAANTRKTKHKKGHPVLSLFLSLVVATGLLGGGVYYFANHFLADLLTPGSGPKPASSSTSLNAGVEFDPGDNSDDGKVPRFVGARVDSVKDNAEMSKQYTLQYEEKFNSDYEAGVIYDQQPLEGTELADGGTVTLYVSKGIETAEMPDVVGLTIESATKLLDEMGIKFDIIPVSDSSLEPGVIIRTNKQEGDIVEVGGEAVMLFIKNETLSSSEEESSSSKSSKSSSKDASSSKIPTKRGSSSKKPTVVTDKSGSQYYIFDNDD